MNYPLLRRLPLVPLDQRVARASMQLCHKIVMQQLYISRVDVIKQWVVVSNPSDQSVDLTGFSLSWDSSSDVFYFPTKYTLLPGDEVKLWCSPRDLKLNEENLLQPYLFWTNREGSLRHARFFMPQAQAHEIVLLDPLLMEVASIRVFPDGRKEFRVLHSKSVHSTTFQNESDTTFCVGCLSPPGCFETQTVNSIFSSCKVMPVPPNARKVYVFSRYWNVVSDKSLVQHFVAVFLVPLLESVRAVLIYIMLCMFNSLSNSKRGTQLQSKLTTLLLMMLVCNVMARKLMLWIKSGLLVTIASLTAVILDRLAVVVLYVSLQKLYPTLSASCQFMLLFDLGVGCVNAAAIHLRFLQTRQTWHPLFKQFARWEYTYREILGICGISRELLLHLLLLLPFSQYPSSMWKGIGYLLVPLVTVAAGVDFLRAVATLHHVIKYPMLELQTYWRRFHTSHEVASESEQDSDFSLDEEPQKEEPPLASFLTPKALRFRSYHPYS